jgi:hypothetical protein
MDLVLSNLIEIFIFVEGLGVSVFRVRLKGSSFHKTVMFVVTAERTFIFEK